MQLSRHLDKGFWALADKGLTAGYGLLFMLLVIRILPESEYGSFVLIQSTFIIVSHLAITLGLSPYVKFYHSVSDRRALQSNAVLVTAGCLSVAALALYLAKRPLAALLNSMAYEKLFYYVLLMGLCSFPKIFTNEMFRASYRIKEIFWNDAAYFASNTALVGALLWSRRFDSAEDLLLATVVSYAVSSVMGMWQARVQWQKGFQLDSTLLRQMFRFGKYTMGSGASALVYDRVDSFILSAYLGPAAVGLFNAAKNFLRVFDLYRQTMATIAFPAFARLHNEGRTRDLRALYEKGIVFSNIVLLPLVLALMLCADFLFDVILAQRYPAGAGILRWLALAGAFIGWQAVGEGLLFGIGESRFPFWSRLAATILSVILNVWLVKALGVMGAVYASIFSYALLAAVSTYFVHQLVGFSLQGMSVRFADLRNFLQERARKKPDKE